MGYTESKSVLGLSASPSHPCPSRLALSTNQAASLLLDAQDLHSRGCNYDLIGSKFSFSTLKTGHV
ncbi:hypothetical protein E2C01_093820 [Portunus trituberculatus]|uniref:Uncharacterized protein n=1 Tax=Portunus trituberculatus TaxID=210409 RepID=A0A5B7JUI1_PORTR|nr:hypothetical protein [Portunus trituberculatus]